jgi:hypothetical protein
MSDLDPNLAYNADTDPLGHLDTKIISIDPQNVDAEEAKFELPSSLIRRGEVVAFPTETVYGLGANAFDPSAVSKVLNFNLYLLSLQVDFLDKKKTFR